jgi:hypothetical protein
MSDELVREALNVLDKYAVTLPHPDLRIVREALQEHLEDENGIHRDDVSEIMQKIDGVLPSQ